MVGVRWSGCFSFFSLRPVKRSCCCSALLFQFLFVATELFYQLFRHHFCFSFFSLRRNLPHLNHSRKTSFSFFSLRHHVRRYYVDPVDCFSFFSLRPIETRRTLQANPSFSFFSLRPHLVTPADHSIPLFQFLFVATTRSPTRPTRSSAVLVSFRCDILRQVFCGDYDLFQFLFVATVDYR